MATGEGLQECLSAIDMDAVINCIAISEPAACERDPSKARSVNIPIHLLDALNQYKSRTDREPLLIFLSTDQVYDGSHAFWLEEDPTEPINAYGRSKLEAEREIRTRWQRHVILRSSIIYGPGLPIKRSLFLQFADEALRSKQPTIFFEDEWRCPIYVQDIVEICRRLVDRSIGGRCPYGTFNMGGPQRLSRVDMARYLANYRGWDPLNIVPVPRDSVVRSTRSPADISMDSTALATGLGFKMTLFSEALRSIFPTTCFKDHDM